MVAAWVKPATESDLEVDSDEDINKGRDDADAPEDAGMSDAES